jgi:hypothetical protein
LDFRLAPRLTGPRALASQSETLPVQVPFSSFTNDGENANGTYQKVRF